jgi:hypothetical protein
MYLITTTVSLDAEKTGAQVILHLAQGDAGTRRLQFVPAAGGRLIDVREASAAKLMAHGMGGGADLLMDCALEGGAIYYTPTAALVAEAETYACQLVLLDDDDQTLKTLPFTVLIHGGVYDGDAVEHTNTTATSVYFDEDGQLTIELADGTKLIADRWEHTHDLATAEKAGFMSPEQFALLANVASWMDQGVKTTDSPTFAGLTVGNVTIDPDGSISGLRFT